MKGAKAFLLLIVVVIAAGALAIFVRQANERIKTPFKDATPSSATTVSPLAPALVVVYAPTSTPPVEPPKEYRSKDGVTTVVISSSGLEGLSFYGTSTAFENQIAWTVTDSSGLLLIQGSAYVSSTDSGLPGPYAVTVEFLKPPRTATGTLSVFEPSAKDGTPLHRVNVTVQLPTPADDL